MIILMILNCTRPERVGPSKAKEEEEEQKERRL
jgi:hypothetical protein